MDAFCSIAVNCCELDQPPHRGEILGGEPMAQRVHELVDLGSGEVVCSEQALASFKVFHILGSG